MRGGLQSTHAVAAGARTSIGPAGGVGEEEVAPGSGAQNLIECSETLADGDDRSGRRSAQVDLERSMIDQSKLWPKCGSKRGGDGDGRTQDSGQKLISGGQLVMGNGQIMSGGAALLGEGMVEAMTRILDPFSPSQVRAGEEGWRATGFRGQGTSGDESQTARDQW